MFQGKIILITGSSTGIGAGIAVKFAAKGASGIVIHGRQEDKLRNVKKQCEEAGNGKIKVHICLGDIAEEQTRQKLINETIQEFGRLDVLVNNAGFCVMCPTSGTPMEIYDKIMDVNLRSAVALTQLAIPHLAETKGNIVNISSATGMRAQPQVTFYCMSKAALDHFTRCLAFELGPQGIRVNGVNPGVIEGTEMELRRGLSNDQAKQYLEAAKTFAALGHVGTVEDVGNVVTFLASDEAKYMTGANVKVDGAWILPSV